MPRTPEARGCRLFLRELTPATAPFVHRDCFQQQTKTTYSIMFDASAAEK